MKAPIGLFPDVILPSNKRVVELTATKSFERSELGSFLFKKDCCIKSPSPNPRL